MMQIEIYGLGGFDPARPDRNIIEVQPLDQDGPADPVVALVETLVAKDVLDESEAAAILAAES